jgi:hypothetical protein
MKRLTIILCLLCLGAVPMPPKPVAPSLPNGAKQSFLLMFQPSQHVVMWRYVGPIPGCGYRTNLNTGVTQALCVTSLPSGHSISLSSSSTDMGIYAPTSQTRIINPRIVGLVNTNLWRTPSVRYPDLYGTTNMIDWYYIGNMINPITRPMKYKQEFFQARR